MRTSMRPWPAISVAAAPTRASARRSTAPPTHEEDRAMTDNSRTTRRHFLVSVAAVGGGLVLGVALPQVSRAAGEIETGNSEVNAWVIVQPDNTVIIRVARSEMGQGILTALPMLVA